MVGSKVERVKRRIVVKTKIPQMERVDWVLENSKFVGFAVKENEGFFLEKRRL